MVKEMTRTELESLIANAKSSHGNITDKVARTALAFLDQAFPPPDYDHTIIIRKIVGDVQVRITPVKLPEMQAFRLVMLLLWTFG